MQEYLDLGHAEPLPALASVKPPDETFYLPIHAVYKASSSTTKVRAVFDASAKSSTGVSLNDTLLVGPTVHPPLLDVLLRFRLYPVALTADISKMYRAVELVNRDRDFHRFVWRSSPEQPLQDYRMTRLTFGVSASSFAANMAVKQNAIDHSHEYPLAAETAQKCFYVDDCLTGATNMESALMLQQQLTDLFARGGFVLRKWNSNDPCVLRSIPEDLRDPRVVQAISGTNDYTKTLGIEWNVTTDQFRLTVANLSPCSQPTKRIVVSDVARIYDVLGWFSPVTVKMKIVLQRLWEIKVGWDDPVPQEICDVWLQWRNELPSLESIHVPRCYSPVGVAIVSMQLHGFSDASEDAYGRVVYLRMTDSTGAAHTSLIISKTKVSPIKRVSIPRLELCGAQVLTKLLCCVKRVLHVPMDHVFAWTDSTIVLNWLDGTPRRFKTYVGNRISSIIDLIPPDRWRHIPGVQNPADLSSRGLFPAEMVECELWWKGPSWLRRDPSFWPEQPDVSSQIVHEEEKQACHLTIVKPKQPLLPFDQFSSLTRLRRVTGWVIRFVNNTRASISGRSVSYYPHLTVQELVNAECFWLSLSQQESFPDEIRSLEADHPLPKSSKLLPFRPFLDKSYSLLRVGGRMSNSKLSYSRSHPIILHGNHPLVKLIVRTEHLRLLHAGPSLLMSSLTQRFHVIGIRKTVRSITRMCIVCKRHSIQPQSQLLGQLPSERVTPAPVFEKVGVDYAGPFQVKYGYVRKPTTVKAYMCLFVCLSVKAVHLEVVSDLTTEAFISSLRRFVARRGCPSLIWSDHGTNFVGAKRELKELRDFLADQATEGAISEFCTSHNIEWKFIPERSPHFGGLWESAVKSAKLHLKRIVSPVRLTFEEFSTVLAQIEACLNSRPLIPADTTCDDGVEMLTPGHFLIGKPLCALPDPQLSYRSVSLLRRWHLCQCLVRHFWQRWCNEYLSSINKYNKWRHPTRNIAVGDIVVLQESGSIPTKWPLARVLETHPGRDGLVRVVTLKTSQGVYKRPVTKLAVLIPQTD